MKVSPVGRFSRGAIGYKSNTSVMSSNPVGEVELSFPFYSVCTGERQSLSETEKINF